MSIHSKLKGSSYVNPTGGELVWYHPLSLFCTWFGSGLIPKAPGTFGTLAALPFAWIILSCFGPLGLFIATLLVFVGGIFASQAYMDRKGTDHDPKEIVIDEVAGIWLLLSLLSFCEYGIYIQYWEYWLFDCILGINPKSWMIYYVFPNIFLWPIYGWITCFLLFRLFDIWKPWPISIADEHIEGGFGIMLDDLLATVYSVAVIFLISLIEIGGYIYRMRDGF